MRVSGAVRIGHSNGDFAEVLGGLELQSEIDISEEATEVLVGRVQIQQVIINLLRNSLEALGRRRS